MSKLDEFRQRFPQYDGIDDARLADALYKKFYSDKVDRDRFNELIGLRGETSLLSYAGETLKAVPRGLINTTLSGIEGGAALVDELGNLVGADDLITEEGRAGIGAFFGDARGGINDSWLGRDEAYADSTAVDIGEGIGSVGAFLLPGGWLKGLGWGQKAISAALSPLAAGLGAGEAEQRRLAAEQAGIMTDPTQRMLTTFGGGAIGLSELATPINLLRKVGRGYLTSEGGSVMVKRLLEAMQSGAIESIQEASAGLMQDALAKGVYNENQPIGDSLMDDATVGGAVGFITDLLVQGVTRRSRIGDTPPGEPPPIGEITEEQRQAELQLRERKEAEEMRRQVERSAMARSGVTGGDAPSGSGGGGGDRFLTGRGEPDDLDAFADELQYSSGIEFPVGAEFSVSQAEDGTFAVTLDEQQFGPRIADPSRAAEFAGRLSERSRRAAREADIEYIASRTATRYNETQMNALRSLARSLPDPDARALTETEVNLAAGPQEGDASLTVAQLQEQRVPRSRWTMSQRINARRIADGLPEVNRFTIKELRQANKGSLGTLGQVLSGRQTAVTVTPVRTPNGYVLRDSNGNVREDIPPLPDMATARQTAVEINQRELLGKSIPAQDMLSEIPGEMEAQIMSALESKNYTADPRSKEMRGFLKSVLGKNVPTINPLRNLRPDDAQYLIQRIRRLPRAPEATPLPDLSQPVPRAESVRIARNNAIRGRETSRAEIESRLGRPVSQAEMNRIEREALRNQPPPIQRAGQVVPEGQEAAVYDPENTNLAQKLRDMLSGFGVSDTYTTRLVDRVGKALRDAEGNITIADDPRAEGALGSVDSDAKVIQVALDEVRRDVANGMTYDAAVSRIMNHEIIHALRNMDLFTAEEWSLLERLSRKYLKPASPTGGGGNMTYAGWAAKTYPDMSPVQVQEEAIAEMFSDALTDGVIMDGSVKKPGGKIRQLINKVVSLFRQLVGFAEQNDVQSFSELVDRVQRGEVGGRERGEVRTLVMTERARREVPERMITVDQLGGILAGRKIPGATPEEQQAVDGAVKKMKAAEVESGEGLVVKVKVPEAEEPALSRREMDPEAIVLADVGGRLARAREQGFITDAIFYHGTRSDNYRKTSQPKEGIKRFSASRLGYGTVKLHVALDPKFSEVFSGGPHMVEQIGEDAFKDNVIYPMFIKQGRYFNAEDIADIEALEDAMADDAGGNTRFFFEMHYAERLKKAMRSKADRMDDPEVEWPSIRVLQSLKQKGRVQRSRVEKELEFRQEVTELARKAEQKAEAALENIKEGDFNYGDLENIAPYLKAAGWNGYVDYEYERAPPTGFALFDETHAKGVFAQFNPEAVPEGQEYGDDIMYSRRSDAGGRSSREMFNGSNSDMFNPETGEVNYEPRHKSRSIVVDMPIDMLLRLAEYGVDRDKQGNVRQVAESGNRFDAIPALYLEETEDGNRIVASHDGRHRSRQLKSMGYDTVPVMIRDPRIRWDQQAEGDFDRVENWPRSIVSEDGRRVFPMFITRDLEVDYGEFGPDGRAFSRRSDTPAAKFVERMYEENMMNPMEGDQFIIPTQTEPTDDGQEMVTAFASVKLKPEPFDREGNTVNLEWINAYPGREGNGTKAMNELLKQVDQAGLRVKLFPWSKGRVSEKDLRRFYRRFGFEDRDGKGGMVREARGSATRDGGDSYSRRLKGMPETFDVNGQAIEFGYHEPALEAAKRYAERAGIPYRPLEEYAPVNPEVATRIAIEYDLMEHAPNDPVVKAAYDAMIEETLAQYEAILETGLDVQFIKGDDPYGNPRNAILDVINNNHMWVFSTRDGYGSEDTMQAERAENPMLRPTDFTTSDGDPMLVNDVFRVVHDYFGHIKNGVGFRARGEENAWQAHAAMYSPLARRAMTSETRGQNSFVNFGPFRTYNQTASGANTVYADQKIGLMPLWTSEDSRLSDDRRQRDGSPYTQGYEGAIRPDGRVILTHYGKRKIDRTDPSLAGTGADARRVRQGGDVPKATYFGIVEATENGYRREKGINLGDVENKFSVDPVLLYPLYADPDGLTKRWPAGNIDLSGTMENVRKNGFIGVFANMKGLGKVALIGDPMISDEAMQAHFPDRDPDFAGSQSSLSRRQPAPDVIDIFSGTEVPPKMKGKFEVGTYLQRRALERLGGKPLNFANAEHRTRIAEALAKEAIYELENNESAMEWYDRTIEETIELLSELHPEIKTNRTARAKFLVGLAITSQNVDVPSNLKFAEQTYDHVKKTGRFPDEGFGSKASSMAKNFEKANKLLDRLTDKQFADFLETEFLVKDLNSQSLKMIGKRANTGQLAEETVFGSAIFGPKIGQGFYTNLRGVFDPVTMDMWFMRTMGRLSGTLMGTSKENVAKAYQRMADALGLKTVNRKRLLDRARAVKKEHERNFKDFRSEYDSGKRKKSETVLAAENLIKLVRGTNDAPRNATERSHLRNIVHQAVDMVEAQTGKRFENAAFQALIWYPEQTLYEKLGVKLKNTRADYATSAEQLLLERGIGASRIGAARRRVRSRAKYRAGSVRRDGSERAGNRRGSGRTDRSVSGAARGVDQQALSRRSHPERDVREAAEEMRERIQNLPPTVIPDINPRASDDAIYIAENPQRAMEDAAEEAAYSRRPEYTPKFTAPAKTRVSPLEAYQRATGEGPVGYYLTKFFSAFSNRYAAIAKLNKNPAFRNNLADTSSIAAVLFADRSRAITAAAIKYGVPVYRDGYTSIADFSHNGRQYRGLLEVMAILRTKEYGDLSQIAQDYAIAQRGVRLNREGKKTPVDAASKAAVEAEVARYTLPDGQNPITLWYEVWQAYNNHVIKYLQDTGMLTPELADKWRDYSDYVPFYREAEGGNLPRPAAGVFGGLTARAFFRPYKGSEESITVDLVDAIATNLNAAIDMGMRNIAQQRIMRDLQRLGLARQIGWKQNSTEVTVDLRVGGIPVRFEVYDPLMAEAMLPLGGQETINMINQSLFLGGPAKLLRELVTREPGFVVANMMRDTLSAFVTSGSSFVPLVDTVRGFADGMERLERGGVVGGYDYANDPSDIGKFFDREMRKRGLDPDSGGMKPLDMFTRIWDAAGQASTRSDAATRNAVYKDVLARTGNEAEALFQAMEILNFGKRGGSLLMRALTATVPFLNARIQGLSVLARGAAGTYSANQNLSRGQVAASFAFRGGLVSAVTALYFALVSDDEQYLEQSEEVRDNNWLIPTSWGAPVRIPIPFEVGLLFKTIPEQIMARSSGLASDKEVAQSIRRAVTGTLAVQPPQFISPLVENIANYDFFTGRSVVPYYMERLEPSERYRASTSEWAKFLGEVTGTAPIKWDNFFNGYSGTLGIYALSTIDRLLKSEQVQGDGVKALPAMNWWEYPVVKRFFAEREGSGLKEDLYDLARDVDTVTATINRLKEQGRIEELRNYLQVRGDLLAVKPAVNKVRSVLEKIRDQRSMIERSDSSPEEKKAQLEALDAQTNKLLKVVPAIKARAGQPAFSPRF